ncbi:MAG TPA: hypothetical protein PKD91_03045 [Bacteroidia bacterium]|nr:hypothetical protein [Bacteroidia bacterium]
MKKQVAAWFLCVFGLMAFLPLFQHSFHPFKLAGLQGAFDKGTPPVLHLANWFNGNFQQHADIYLKNNTGFNGELVRLRNQADYSLFGNINTNLTLGRENYIFDPNYIYAREGTDVLPDSVLLQNSLSLQQSKLLLDSLQIPLLFCFAPNKANFYPEFLPTVSPASEITNQTFFKNIFLKNNVWVIDFDSWFVELKKTSKYPLIPKYGAHWSTYGAAIAGDSLLKTIGKLTHKDLVLFDIRRITTDEKPRFTDDDYLASLNLMKKWKSPEMAYPEIGFTKGVKPNVLIISDSFIWNFYDLGIIQNCFSEKSSVWYYNKTAFDFQKNNLGPLSENLKKEDILNRDAVILIATGPSLKDFGYNFFEQLNTAFLHE